MSGTRQASISEATVALDAWDLGSALEVEPLVGGLIHSTFLVRGSAEAWVLQRVHGMFPPAVNADLFAVTEHIAKQGVLTPRLVRTRRAGLCSQPDDGTVWRVLTFVPGATVARGAAPAALRSAGALVGRFHRALATLEHTFAAPRRRVHDTAAHRLGLERAMDRHRDHAYREQALQTGDAILATLDRRPPLPEAPSAVMHGDLKLSNVRFDCDGAEAVALLDLDTAGPGVLAVELGDALRSWCNPQGEDDPGATFDVEACVAALSGYASAAGEGRWSSDASVAALAATETIAAELAARFCRDVFEECYFGWDPLRFPCAAAHNLVRARSQLSLAHSVREQRQVALRALRAAGGWAPERGA